MKPSKIILAIVFFTTNLLVAGCGDGSESANNQSNTYSSTNSYSGPNIHAEEVDRYEYDYYDWGFVVYHYRYGVLQSIRKFKDDCGCYENIQ